MKRFEFRLDPVLRLREAQLESEQTKLKSILNEKQRLTSALEALASERLSAKQFLCSRTDLDGMDLRNMSSFMLGTEARDSALRKHLEEIGRAIQEQRKRVMKMDRNVRLLTKLRDKKLEQWKCESDRELETIAQESWLVARHARKASANSSPTADLPRISHPIHSEDVSGKNLREISHSLSTTPMRIQQSK